MRENQLILNTKHDITITVRLKPILFRINVNQRTLDSLDGSGHDLVEDVVGPLERLLGDDTGFFQQVCRNIKITYTDTDSFTMVLHVSMSAPASFPVGPKWMRMNLP